MLLKDDTEIFPADERGDTPAPKSRVPHGAVAAPAPRQVRDSTTLGTPAGLSPWSLTTLLRALSVWST